MKNRPCFVFDTNALISALLLPDSISRQAFKLADETGRLLFSKETPLELSEVLLRPKFDKWVSAEDRLTFIEMIESRYECVNTISDFNNCRDVKDNKFLNLAFDAEASYIITGDKDLLELNPFKDISIFQRLISCKHLQKLEMITFLASPLPPIVQ